MRTFSILKNQPVFDMQSGMKIGEVSDLFITSDGVVKGILVKKDIFFKKTAFLDIQNIASFGTDGIMIENVDLLEKLKTPPEYTFSHQHPLNGQMIVSKSGDSIGLLKDVYFLEELGTIVGYEITDGFFSDITEGKQVIQSEKPPAIGKDAIIVDVNQT
ncbi:photosystem reaction center subunit H [Bacillus sp. MUM 116]|uniref:PRC-barrel domain-containing protein n=1 Tax=Bacillus sp. MUM 116 TaxID=1678002 RepID=UPI0008F5590F|nr:PRC-barrel domain-containing protein [Bacillus sp. MUM 116]OIK17022.1 photosystem reaction center subunit H [Bacillus sp. MUM 116]